MMQRFDIFCIEGQFDQVEDPEGEWVRFTAAQKAQQAAYVQGLRNAAETVRSIKTNAPIQGQDMIATILEGCAKAAIRTMMEEQP